MSKLKIGQLGGRGLNLSACLNCAYLTAWHKGLAEVWVRLQHEVKLDWEVGEARLEVGARLEWPPVRWPGWLGLPHCCYHRWLHYCSHRWPRPRWRWWLEEPRWFQRWPWWGNSKTWKDPEKKLENFTGSGWGLIHWRGRQQSNEIKTWEEMMKSLSRNVFYALKCFFKNWWALKSLPSTDQLGVRKLGVWSNTLLPHVYWRTYGLDVENWETVIFIWNFSKSFGQKESRQYNSQIPTSFTLENGWEAWGDTDIPECIIRHPVDCITI